MAKKTASNRGGAKKSAAKRTGGRGARAGASNPPVRRVWLAGLGVASIARKRSEAAVDSIRARGAQVRGEADKLAKGLRRDFDRAKQDAEKQLRSAVRPVRQRAQRVARKIEGRLSARVESALGRFGVPSRADLAELTQRIDALNRRIAAARPRAA